MRRWRTTPPPPPTAPTAWRRRSSISTSARSRARSTPTATHGTVYSVPVHIAGTTTLRAAAFKAGFLPTNVDTETYLFLGTVQNQTVPSTGYPASNYPATWAGDQGTGGTGLPSGTY